MDDSFISLKGINKVYPNGAQAVFDFNLDIKKQEFVVLVGPSGCGKSTTLRMIAGLENITSGEFYIDNILSNYVPSKDRQIAMVFQSYALYPNMTVYDNIAFGLKIQKVDKDEIRKRVFEVAKILDLGSYLDRFPKELSGGQMQRVALGRAIVRKVPIFLMDEPLSNLDAKLRVSMRSEIVRIHQDVGSTTIYVTHDQVEAMTMADKIVVMNKGFVQQIGSPAEIYSQPINSFVATFIGTPAMNLLYADYSNGTSTLSNGINIKLPFAKEQYLTFLGNEIKNAKERFDNYDIDSLNYLLRIESNRANLATDVGTTVKVSKKPSFLKRMVEKIKNSHIDGETKKLIKRLSNLEEMLNNSDDAELRKEYDELKSKYDALYLEEDKKVNPEKYRLHDICEQLKLNSENEHKILIGIRPEKIKLSPATGKEEGKLVLKAEIVELLGSEYYVYFTLDGRRIVAKVDNSQTVKEGEMYVLNIEPKDIYCFDLVTGKTIK